MARMKGGYWMEWGRLPLEDVQSNLFTHMYYAFAEISTSTHKLLAPTTDNFRRFTAVLRVGNPGVKTLLSIGGGTGAATASFDSMVVNRAFRSAFIRSAINVARENNFDGLDVDYEYPRNPGLMANLGELLAELRAAVNAEAGTSGRTPLLLTAAVYYKPVHWGGFSFPVEALKTNLDWINVMCYDLSAWEWADPIPGTDQKLTGPAAALYDPTGSASGSHGIEAWIRAGVPANKIVLGLPFYGHGWTLLNANNKGYRARAIGQANPPGRVGSWDYREIQTFLATNPSAVAEYDPDVVGNRCHLGTTWISYDDERAITRKVAYAREKNLMGYFAWRVGGDGNGFPLAIAAYNAS